MTIGLAIAALSIGTVAFAAVTSEPKTNFTPAVVEFDYDIANMDKVFDNVYQIAVDELGIEKKESKEERIKQLKDTGILNSFGLFGEYNGDIEVTKETLAQFMSDIVEKTRKNNVPATFVSTVKDALSYDVNMEYIDYNSLIPIFDNYFIGETALTNNDANDCLVLFSEVLSKTSPNEEQITEPAVISEVYTSEVVQDNTTQESQQEAISALSGRTFVDDLYGKSVAVYKEPQNIKELNANLRALNVGDPYNNSNNYDFINVDQGLYDYSMIKVDYVPELAKISEEEFNELYRVKGIAMCRLAHGMTVSEDNNYVRLWHKNISDMGTSKTGEHAMVYRPSAYLISNNKVISEGSIYLDGKDKEVKMKFDKNDFEKSDYIGLITQKSVLTGKEYNSSDFILVLFKIDSYLKG